MELLRLAPLGLGGVSVSTTAVGLGVVFDEGTLRGPRPRGAGVSTRLSSNVAVRALICVGPRLGALSGGLSGCDLSLLFLCGHAAAASRGNTVRGSCANCNVQLPTGIRIRNQQCKIFSARTFISPKSEISETHTHSHSSHTFSFLDSRLSRTPDSRSTPCSFTRVLCPCRRGAASVAPPGAPSSSRRRTRCARAYP